MNKNIIILVVGFISICFICVFVLFIYCVLFCLELLGFLIFDSYIFLGGIWFLVNIFEVFIFVGFVLLF